MTLNQAADEVRKLAKDRDEVLRIRIIPENSPWRCYLFGRGPGGFCYIPLKGQEPNAFWRLMQFLILGHRWVKEENMK